MKFEVVLACVLVAACGGSGRVTGQVKEIEAGPLPGVHVTVDGLEYRSYTSLWRKLDSCPTVLGLRIAKFRSLTF